MSRLIRSRGFSLIELMVAMALGLVIVGGVVSVMLANKRSYRTNEGLSQIQESARTAYELIARDVRQSGTTGCDNARKMGNLLANASTVWWQAWEGVHGYSGTETDSAVTTGAAQDQRVNGTDSIRLRGIYGRGFPIESHDATSGTIVLQTANSTATSLTDTDSLIVCDFDHSTMFKSNTWDGSTRTISYNGTGNCSTGMGFPTNCDGSTGLVYTFQRNAWVGRMGAVDWYVGNNARGGRSLYRMRLDSGSNLRTEEVVAGISDMQIQYGVNGSDTIAPAASIAAADWANVNSVFITVTVDSSDTNVTTDAATNAGRIRRTFTYVITLRNRVA